MAIDEIGLSSGGLEPLGLGSRLVFYRDGRATRRVMRDRLPGQDLTGTPGVEQLEGLAGEVQDNDFFDLDDHYGELASGEPYRTTTVVRDGTTKVTDSGDAAPPNLKAVQDAIGALAERTEWTELI
jgi:hypothetical protein